jgi:ribosomal protein S18 acetylase RimI-like enzyme
MSRNKPRTSNALEHGVMPDTAVRPAIDADFSGIAKLYSQVGFRAGLVDDVRFVRDVLGGRVFVAERDGEVVGASAGLLFGRSGWLGGIAVSPSAQRQGLGGALTAETPAHDGSDRCGTVCAEVRHRRCGDCPLDRKAG